ncbi:hypothetical protein IMZ48_45925 [Candidatus Bathyarchaeota archaeon]|nr:hypothetical protein [Candidatus Bathyarchaeota archaeon]
MDMSEPRQEFGSDAHVQAPVSHQSRLGGAGGLEKLSLHAVMTRVGMSRESLG